MKRNAGIMFADIELELRDKDGKLVKRYKQRSKSFVANFLRILRRMMLTSGIVTGGGAVYRGVSGTEPVDIDGNARAVLVGIHTVTTQPVSKFVMKGDGGVADITSGCVVGTGNTPPTPTDKKLEAIIPEGEAEGQLSYGATTVDNLSIIGSDVILKIIRIFSNNSAVEITVREVGIYVLCAYSETANATHCIARDVLVTPIAIPSGLSLTLRYIIKTTV